MLGQDIEFAQVRLTADQFDHCESHRQVGRVGSNPQATGLTCSLQGPCRDAGHGSDLGHADRGVERGRPVFDRWQKSDLCGPGRADSAEALAIHDLLPGSETLDQDRSAQGKSVKNRFQRGR